MSTEDQARASEETHGSPNTARVTFEDVRKSELDEVARRRSEAKLKDAEQSPDNNLVGLALSGGGIRSAAFSLGVLRSLHVRGVLPFVDYLSTVSGGGYAGASLSSYILSTRKNWKAVSESEGHAGPKPAQAPQKADETGHGRTTKSSPVSDATMLRSGKLAERMRQFLFSGNYLRRTWVFFNRYLIGLLLIWAVTFSGLIAAASGIAWAFRSLDHPHIRSWLAALGFDGDARLAFFPAFVLLLIWLVAWGISYFRSLSRAEGNFARHLFYLVVVTTLVATASLISMRHISLNYGTDAEGQTAGWIGQTIGTIIISAIGASLIPYLRPKALIRSGTNPQNATEKYTFWIASRALLYGVPFVVVAWFARENISEFNRSRDASLTFSEIKDWETAYAPLFLQMRDEWAQRPTTPATTSVVVTKSPGHLLWERLVPSDAMTLVAGGPTINEKPFQELDAEFHRYYAWLLPNNRDNVQRDPDHLLGDKSRMLSPLKRWWYFVQYSVIRSTREDGAGNPTHELVRTRDQILETKTRILDRLNHRILGSATLYKYFPASEAELSNPTSTRKTQLAHVFPLVERAREIQDSQDKLEKARPGPGNTEEELQRKLLADEERERAIMEVNRDLLSAYYPGTITDKSTIFSSVVLDADQAVRWNWFVGSACIFLVVGLIVDLNATSWHAFYSRQMAHMWIEPVAGCGRDGRDIPLARLSNVEYGWPYHLISGSLQLFGRRRTAKTVADRQSFLFSRLYCGTDPLSYAPTKDYMGGNYLLADAIAISGAAVSPVQSRNPLVTALMFFFNVRLGQWVANPSYVSQLPKGLADFVANLPFTPLRLLSEMVRNAEDRPHCFVTDGGHYENLAIEPLLKRRCRLIIASDAGQDEDYQFLDLMRLIRWAGINQGIEFVPIQERDSVLNLAPLIPDKTTNLSSKHFLVMKIKYPPDNWNPASTGFLVYLKSSLCKDDPVDLLNYRRIHSQFPHDETSDQFYDPDRFFCYWKLGKHIAERACENLSPGFEKTTLSTTVDHFIDEFVGIQGRSPVKPEGDGGDDPAPSGRAPHPAAPTNAREEANTTPDHALEELICGLLQHSNHADDVYAKAAKEALAVLGPDTLNHFGRGGLNPLPPIVLAEVIKELFDARRAHHALDHDTLVNLTDQLVNLLNPAQAISVRLKAIDALAEVIQFSRAGEKSDVISRIEKELVHLCRYDREIEVARAAAYCLKRVSPRVSARIRKEDWYQSRGLE